MSPFILMPVIVAILRLIHVYLGVAGSSAYRYTRWTLFGGLAVLALSFFLALVAAISAPAGPGASEFSGGLEFILTLETVLVGLAAALLEIFSVFVMTAVRIGAEKREPGRPRSL